MSAANDMSNEARNLGNQAAAGAGRVADDAREELARLRGQVERLMRERVTPALGDAADSVSEYGRRARETVEDQAETISETVRDRPLTSVVVAAIGGYLLGRLMSGNTYVYRNDRR